MKKSIKSLPKCTQEELNVLRDLIVRYIPSCTMLLLFGSYAKKTHVLFDSKIEFGTPTTYQSDLDLMIVVPTASMKHIYHKVSDKIRPKYHAAFEHRRHAPLEIIVESIEELNKNLEKSHYFFTEIVKDCIMLYDRGEYQLAKPRELSYKEIRKFAEEHFALKYPLGSSFLGTVKNYSYYQKEYVLASFFLHQACEKFYNAISLVFTNYCPKNHKLEEIGSPLNRYSRELINVFPKNTPYEEYCYKLLCKAYIEGRYNPNFIVTKEDIDYLIPCIEKLQNITNRICNERIEHYRELEKIK